MKFVAVKCLFVLSMLLIMAGPSMAADKPAAAPEKAASENVAVVNGTAISRTDFDQELQFVLQQYMVRGQRLDEAQLAQIRGGLLDNLIGRQLLYQKAKDEGVTADPKLVEERMALMKTRFGGDEEQYKQGLKAMNLTEESLAKKLEEGLVVEQFVDQKFADSIAVSEEELQEFYDANSESFKVAEQVRASHILVQVDKGADEAAKKAARDEIEGVQKELQNGRDFAEMAKEHSDCPSAVKGGDLGYFGRGQMVKPFEDAAFATEVGQMSGIVETPFGYHIIKVTDKKPARTISFNEARPRLAQHLKAQKVKTAIDAYVTQLESEAKIEKTL